MAHYRKKPVVIEAIQWDGKNFDEVSNFTQIFHGHKKAYEDAQEGANKTGKYLIRTLEGIMEANPGDWIIKGIKGEFYPCKPDIFEATYEPVPSEEKTNETTTEDTTLDNDGNGGNHPPGGPGKP